MNGDRKEKKSIFDGYVIPYVKDRSQKSEAIRLWMVELTLTSGEVHTFYIKAKDYADAQEKAQKYEYLAEMPQQLRKGFMFRS